MRHGRNHWFGLALIGVVIVTVVFSMARESVPTAQAQSGGVLGYGSKIYGTLSATAPQVTYSFSGNPGDFVVITADSWTGTLDIQIDLVAPNGVILDHSAQNTPGGDPMGAYLSIFLPDAGIYLLRLSGENGTMGNYLLTLLGRSAATSTPLIYGQAVDVTVPQDAAAQFFSFEAENCPTTLVISNPTFPFAVKVRDQRGQTVALLRGGDQLEDWVTVQPNSGRYEVEVLAAEPGIAGSIRLLVTCSGDNPGCLAGVAGLPGAAECTPCPGPDELVSGGGCPDLGLTAQQDPLNPQMVTVRWNPMSGADGYAVYVTSFTTDGGEVYLTHAEWVPGDPTQFTWMLPTEGYMAFDFTLRVLVGDSVLCSQQTHIDIRQTEPDCPNLGLNAVITDTSVNAVTLNWIAGLGADQFDLDMYSIIDTGEEYSGRLILPGDSTGRAFDHFPPHLNGVRFVLWMWKAGRLCSNTITVMFEEIPAQQVTPTCTDFNLTVTASTGTQVDLAWTAYPGVDGYAYLLMDESRNPVPGHSVIMSASQLYLGLVSPPLAPGTYIASISPWDDTAGAFCTSEVTISFEESQAVPCAIRADREGVEVRVGPSLLRNVFTYLNPGIEYGVIGQTVDEGGSPWWEVDKTQFAGHEEVISLWVAQSDVTALGNCTQIPQAEIPPVIPGEPGQQPSGAWQPCGSCNTCGHPSNECVTSPEGLCLWDPATCTAPPPPQGGPNCYAVTAAIDMGSCYGSGSAMIDTAPNCEGGLYLPGTAIQAHALAVDPKCAVKSWSGCGASGGGASISFVPSGSCTVTAHMGY